MKITKLIYLDFSKSKRLLLYVFCGLFLSSCQKADSITVVDNPPEFDPEIIEYQGTITRDDETSFVTCAGVYTFYEETGELLNYSFSLAWDANSCSFIIGAFTPDDPTETSLQEGEYTCSFVSSITEEGLLILNEWKEAGENEEDMPDLNDLLYTHPNTESLFINFSEITEDSVRVELYGTLLNEDNTTLSLDAAYVAEYEQ